MKEGEIAEKEERKKLQKRENGKIGEKEKCLL